MPTVHGINTLSYTPQPDFNARQSENGGWQASQSFTINKADLDNYAFRQTFSQGVTPRSIDSDVAQYWDFLGLVSVDVTGTEGAVSTIIVRYSGSEATYDGEGPQAEITTYSLSGSMSQRSVIFHPDVVALGAEDRRKIGLLLDGAIEWDEDYDVYRHIVSIQPVGSLITFTHADAITWAEKIVRGETTFDAPTILWTEYKERDVGLTAAELNNIGKVDTPGGTPPAVTGGRDWRLNNATQDFDGMLYRITRQWELSLKGGWDSDTYDY